MMGVEERAGGTVHMRGTCGIHTVQLKREARNSGTGGLPTAGNHGSFVLSYPTRIGKEGASLPSYFSILVFHL